MNVKAIIVNQYREKVNQAAAKLRNIARPPEGWLCTTRKALGMSAAQLARRLGKSRALVSNTEKAELEGGVTLHTLQAMAQALNCRLVYAIVPEESVERILEARATVRATQLVMQASQHMALEDQAISPKQEAFEIDRLAKAMRAKPPHDFWNDEVL